MSDKPTPSDEELKAAFTKDSGGPNPYYRCNRCGVTEPGLRKYLAIHYQNCPVPAIDVINGNSMPSGRDPAVREYVSRPIDEVDSCIFTGDSLWIKEERDLLIEYVARWQRAIDEHRRNNPEEYENAK